MLGPCARDGPLSEELITVCVASIQADVLFFRRMKALSKITQKMLPFTERQATTKNRVKYATSLECNLKHLPGNRPVFLDPTAV